MPAAILSYGEVTENLRTEKLLLLSAAQDRANKAARAVDKVFCLHGVFSLPLQLGNDVNPVPALNEEARALLKAQHRPAGGGCVLSGQYAA